MTTKTTFCTACTAAVLLAAVTVLPAAAHVNRDKPPRVKKARKVVVKTKPAPKVAAKPALAPEEPQTRDPYLWPFAQDSIWNMPIGSEAQYVPARLGPAGYIGNDTEYIFKLDGSAKERPLYQPHSWTERAKGTTPTPGRGSFPLPDDLLMEDAKPGSTPNNCVAFILPDGKTVAQIAPFTRVEKGGPAYGWFFGEEDLRGPGMSGSHGGSGLSAMGGSIRKGELTGAGPIRHALKVNLFGEKYISYNEDSTRGYRWPATRSDSYAAGSYKGQVPELEMGALLAIPPTIQEASLGLKTDIGRKLFRAMQDYGAYLVDDAAWDCHYLLAESGVDEEVKAKYGYSLHGASGALKNDINTLFQALYVVANNGPNRIGGGGTPRRPLAPPFAQR